jgi:protein-disulfide isomerase
MPSSSRPRLFALALLSVLGCRREQPPLSPAGGSEPVGPAPAASSTPSQSTHARPWRDALRVDRLAIRIPDFTPARGAASPLVTIVHFGDYTHPDSIAQAKIIGDALTKWPDDIRVAFVHVPQNPSKLARQLAQLAAAAGAQHRFWEAHDRLFAQPVGKLEDAGKVLAGIGIDVDAALKATEDRVHAPWLAGSITSARELGIARPGVVMVNGRSPDDVALGELIAAERDTMASLVADGLPRADIYAELLASASMPAPLAPPPKPGELDGAVNYAIPVAGRPVVGPPDALITITVFSDFQCPFCQRAHGICAELRRRHPDDVRCAFHNLPLPFHSRARELARAALAADALGKFWEMHDAIFAIDAGAPDGWKAAAKRANLDPKKLVRGMKSAEVARRIAEDERLAKALGVSGTPTFFVNGRPMPGANDVDAFEAVIAEELPKAREFAARDPGGEGTFYDRMIAELFTADALDATP